jgi:DNA-binding transcriptional regulator YiaG
MSRKLSFKEALARPAGARDESHASSASCEETEAPKVKFLLLPGKMTRPVDVAKTLRELGMPLRKAHEALNRLALKNPIVVHLDANKERLVVDGLAALGISAARMAVPNPDIKQIREKLGASQKEFASRFFLEVDTLQNWEQGRNEPDAPTKVLLKIIDVWPEIVYAALTADSSPMARNMMRLKGGD